MLELVVAEKDSTSRNSFRRLISARSDLAFIQHRKISGESLYKVESSSSLLASRVVDGAVARRRMVSPDAIEKCGVRQRVSLKFHWSKVKNLIERACPH